MADGRQEIRIGQSRGRPATQDPKCERITIRFTGAEYGKILLSAGDTSISVHARNTLLRDAPPRCSEQSMLKEAWRTLDLLTRDMIRIHEAIELEHLPDEDVLARCVGQVLDALDEVRVLLLGTAPRS